MGASAMSGMSAGFHAVTIMRRLSGRVFSVSTTSAIWSMLRPSGLAQERHCLP